MQEIVPFCVFLLAELQIRDQRKQFWHNSIEFFSFWVKIESKAPENLPENMLSNLWIVWEVNVVLL